MCALCGTAAAAAFTGCSCFSHPPCPVIPPPLTWSPPATRSPPPIPSLPSRVLLLLLLLWLRLLLLLLLLLVLVLLLLRCWLPCRALGEGQRAQQGCHVHGHHFDVLDGCAHVEGAMFKRHVQVDRVQGHLWQLDVALDE
mgnify:FL=1